jgi:hypothetical protein
VLFSKRPAVLLSLAILLTSVTACGKSPTAKTLEQSLAADPRLKDNPGIFGGSEKNQPQAKEKEAKAQLPSDFPQDIPLYPNAQLQSVTLANGSQNGVVTRWLSSDPSNFITNFYSEQLEKSNWQVLQQPTDDLPDTFEVQRDNLQVKVSIQPQSVTNPQPDQPQTVTVLVIEYLVNSRVAAEAKTESNGNVFGSDQDNLATERKPTLKSQQFNDLKEAPPELRQSIEDLAALGVLSVQSAQVKNNSNDTITNSFAPSKNITRREYARWLVGANNAMYVNNPAKQVRLVSQSSEPSFSDVPKTDVDFSVIQGLAEAGLVPSLLSGDSTAVLFRPDAVLTREQLILWKVPLDIRQPLPTASLEAVNQSWGFQDTAKIDPKALRAVLADFQNGSKSNIRRVFGYTTLFQPKKPVSRAEAAGALSYFGTEGEGISAGEMVRSQKRI